MFVCSVLLEGLVPRETMSKTAPLMCRGIKALPWNRGSSMWPWWGGSAFPQARGWTGYWWLQRWLRRRWLDGDVDGNRPHACLVQRLRALLGATRWIQRLRSGPMACGASMIRPARLTARSWIFESWMPMRLLVATECETGGRLRLYRWYRLRRRRLCADFWFGSEWVLNLMMTRLTDTML